MTKTAFNGSDVFFLIHSTTALASGTRNGGSIKTADFEPRIRVLTLDRPFSDETRWSVCRVEDAILLVSCLSIEENLGRVSLIYPVEVAAQVQRRTSDS